MRDEGRDKSFLRIPPWILILLGIPLSLVLVAYFITIPIVREQQAFVDFQLDIFNQVELGDDVERVVELYDGLPKYRKEVGDWTIIEFTRKGATDRAERTKSEFIEEATGISGTSTFLLDENGRVLAKLHTGDVGTSSSVFSELYFYIWGVTAEDIPAWKSKLPGNEEINTLGPPLEFSLEDQNEELHTEAEFLDAPIVFMISDKGGSQYSKQWSKAIYEAMDARGVDRIRIVPVPQLGIVPDLARGLARKMVADDLGGMFALLDWESTFTEKYALEKGRANYLLFDAQGALLRKESVQELDEAVLQDLVDEIVKVMEAHQESAADDQ